MARKARLSPCNCVLRAIFRACYSHFCRCATKEKHISRLSLEYAPGKPGGSFTWGRKDEEFMADFVLISRRTLAEADYRVFKYHFLLGADFRLCCRKLGMERGAFFHAVYRVEQSLGRVFRELEPYGLFPLDDYYNGPRRRCPVTPQMQASEMLQASA